MAPYTSPFFSNTTGYTGETTLLDDLVREQIKLFGVDVMYLPRKMLNLDKLLHESTKNAFELAMPMPAYVKSFDGYDNSMEMLTKFGVRNSDELTLQISRSEFTAYYAPFLKAYYNANAGRDPLADLERLDGETEYRAKEGDLIYFPFDDAIFEIKYVQFDVPFFQLGRNYVFELQCEKFEYSGDTFNTGYDQIDDTTIEPDYYRMEFSLDKTVTPNANSFIFKERVKLYNLTECDFDAIDGGDSFWVDQIDYFDNLHAFQTIYPIDEYGQNAVTDGGSSNTLPDESITGYNSPDHPVYTFFTDGGDSAIAVPTEPDIHGGHAPDWFPDYCGTDIFRLYKDAGYVYPVEVVEGNVEIFHKPNGILTVSDLTNLDPEQPDDVKDLTINKFDKVMIVGQTSGAVWFSYKAHTQPKAFDDGELIQQEFDAIKIIDNPEDVNPFGFV